MLCPFALGYHDKTKFVIHKPGRTLQKDNPVPNHIKKYSDNI